MPASPWQKVLTPKMKECRLHANLSKLDTAALLPLNSGPPQTEQQAAKDEENKIFIPFMKKFWLTSE